ncbi:hypothetical protein J3U68_08005 [Snodgrassella sp. B3882]|uniref:hypothetical protein n=1 Tax=Snodgrassella sp. B3882 TaxID=2818037 RepID=UPI002269B82D|nr:hypothetical protein [Snodgrassella sp. B3882]MCX8745350.1 hypothetical protein [Snodgrassella sp. B3882]
MMVAVASATACCLSSICCKSGNWFTWLCAVLMSLWIPSSSTLVSLPLMMICPGLKVAWVVLLSLPLWCCGMLGV